MSAKTEKPGRRLRNHGFKRIHLVWGAEMRKLIKQATILRATSEREVGSSTLFHPTSPYIHAHTQASCRLTWLPKHALGGIRMPVAMYTEKL